MGARYLNQFISDLLVEKINQAPFSPDRAPDDEASGEVGRVSVERPLPEEIAVLPALFVGEGPVGPRGDVPRAVGVGRGVGAGQPALVIQPHAHLRLGLRVEVDDGLISSIKLVNVEFLGYCIYIMQKI